MDILNNYYYVTMCGKDISGPEGFELVILGILILQLKSLINYTDSPDLDFFVSNFSRQEDNAIAWFSSGMESNIFSMISMTLEKPMIESDKKILLHITGANDNLDSVMLYKQMY